MTDPVFSQLRIRVVEPILARISTPARRLDSPAAVNLVLGTCAQETGFNFIGQYPAGPAVSPWQIEPVTHDKVRARLKEEHPDLDGALDALLVPGIDPHAQLAWNLAYAAAFCRLLYWLEPRPLPAANDLAGLAAYWKDFYNTRLGKGTVDEFQRNYRLHIGEPT
ncbi:hypothetical protein [Nitrospirillum amazonense]|uniref:hypothetical protein n=1 Tax=Nitrospirillum amazonense TaxID=28077 RepID=UPI00241285DA|nr:hypothetical protein [Nitrospirillum amazonense]MDG3442455.1 hypothetical protein [Nitrospirillum amazonense]